jgi:hypothetical protein
MKLLFWHTGSQPPQSEQWSQGRSLARAWWKACGFLQRRLRPLRFASRVLRRRTWICMWDSGPGGRAQNGMADRGVCNQGPTGTFRMASTPMGRLANSVQRVASRLCVVWHLVHLVLRKLFSPTRARQVAFAISVSSVIHGILPLLVQRLLVCLRRDSARWRHFIS